MSGRKILCDTEDLFSAFYQTKDLAANFVEKHFDELYKSSYGKSKYHGQLEKKMVLEEMEKWVETAFNIVVSNTEGHNVTSITTDYIDKDLVESIDENKAQMEIELEKLIKKRKQVAESMNQFIQLSKADRASLLDSVEFIHEEKEQEDIALPTLKRPLEEVKKDYKASYESLGQLCEELESKRNRLESYQNLAKQLMDE